jgi:hypothetical protein
MTTDVEEILEAVRILPLPKQLEVLQSLVHSLSGVWPQFLENSVDFWSRRSADDLAAEQRAPVVADLAEFTMPDWPTDESAEDLNAHIRAQRDADRLA